MSELNTIIDQLLPKQKKEVSDFALFLLEKKRPPKQSRLQLNWAGGLSEYKNKYTSIDLQKKSLQWWGGS